MVSNAFLKQLNEEPWFKAFLENDVVPDIPQIPAYLSSDDNTEQWKYVSGMREGYLMCLRKLGVYVHER